MRPLYRMIVSDLDGTLLNDAAEITPRTLNAIKKAQERGIIFAACTGRFPENTAMVLMEKGIDCPVISLNGSVVELSPLKGRIFERFLEPRSAREVFDALESLGEGYHVFGRGTVASRRAEVRHHSETDLRRDTFLKSEVRFTHGLDACRTALERPVYKFYVYLTSKSKPPEAIRAALGGIEGVSLTQSSETNFELIPSGADKGTGLELLSRHLDIRPREIIAFGDQLNDLPMLRFAGLGVAVGSAAELVRQAAGLVARSNNDDGVARVIEEVCLS